MRYRATNKIVITNVLYSKSNVKNNERLFIRDMTVVNSIVPCEWQVVVWYKEPAASLQEDLLCQVCTATRAGNKEPET